MKRTVNVIVYGFAVIGFVLVGGFFAVKFGLTNAESVVIDNQRAAFLGQEKRPFWVDHPEWQTFSAAIAKDKEAIHKAAQESGVSARLIVAQVAAEQLRLYYTNRDLFKEVFSPLKILGNQSQFSWGVAGIKQETAIETEHHLKDTFSPFYLGKDRESLLDFTTSSPDNERFERIVNEESRYYSYLYTGLILKQLETQWEKAGFSIIDNVGVLSTLFNIGFEHSRPHAHPEIGGSELMIGDMLYNFGSLAISFYQSDELLDIFPRK